MTNPGTSITGKPYNPFHLREYDVDEFASRLRTHFPSVELFGQSFWSQRYGRALRSLSRAHPLVAVRSHQARKVAGAVVDRDENHVVRPLAGGAEPEALVAVCRLRSSARATERERRTGRFGSLSNRRPHMFDRGFYVTTPIYYISGNPHIGHAYTSIAADVLARYHRTLGATRFLTGTDEHGQKVAAAAAAAGLSPGDWCDTLVPRWKELLAVYDVRVDDFIRTTEPRHTTQVVEVFERLKATGDVYLGTYEGWYCTNDETFWLEAKLVDGRCPNLECGRAVQWLSEDNWFFALGRYRDRLLTYYRDHPQWVRPERAYNEMVATLEGGLEDLCISRLNLDWGVPLPGGGVMYVWLDALLNYITALEYASDGEAFRTFWPASVQLIGKEIARFHTIVWPAVLWALGLPAPELVFAHGWMTLEGEKMSKSRGNVVDPFDVAAHFGADSMRYFLMREAPFGSDFSFSEEKVRLRRNGDLGNDLGNLVKRSLAMLARYRDGVVPPSREASHAFGARFADLGARTAARLDAVDFRGALETIWELVTALNREIDDRKPWELQKRGDDATLDTVLYDLCEGLRWLAHLCAPFMPGTARGMWTQLGFAGEPAGTWAVELVWGRLASGTRTAPSDVALFPRMDVVASA